MGKGGGGGGPDPPWDSKLFQEYYEQILAGTEGGVAAYPGDMVAGMSGDEQRALSAIGNLGNTGMSDDRRGIMAEIMSGELPFDVGPDMYEEQFRTSIEAPARFNFQDQIQEIMHRYGSGGATGATVDQLGRSMSEFELGLAGQHADMRVRGMEREQDIEMANRQMMPDMLAASRQEDAFGPQMALEAGGFGRAYEQSLMNEDYFKWMSEQAYANPWLGHVQSAMGFMPYQTPVESQVPTWLAGIPMAGNLITSGIDLFGGGVDSPPITG